MYVNIRIMQISVLMFLPRGRLSTKLCIMTVVDNELIVAWKEYDDNVN